jgi:hypothetical protein
MLPVDGISHLYTVIFSNIPQSHSLEMQLIVVFLQRRMIEKLPFLLVNALLLYIPLLALTDR